MILTESKLKQIIAEELENLMAEERLDEINWNKLKRFGAGALAAGALTAAGMKAGQSTGGQGMSRHAMSGQIAQADDTGEQDGLGDSHKGHRHPDPRRVRKNTTRSAVGTPAKNKDTNMIKTIRSPLDKVEEFKNSEVSEPLKAKIKAFYNMSNENVDVYDAIMAGILHSKKYKTNKDLQALYAIRTELRSKKKPTTTIDNFIEQLENQN